MLPAVADVGDIPVIALGYDTPEPPIIGVAPFDVQAKAAESLQESEKRTNSKISGFGFRV
jgi:hypothetical protein